MFNKWWWWFHSKNVDNRIVCGVCPGPVFLEWLCKQPIIYICSSRFVGYKVKHTLIWSSPRARRSRSAAQTHNTKRILHKHAHSLQLFGVYLASNCKCFCTLPAAHINCTQSPSCHPTHGHICSQCVWPATSHQRNYIHYFRSGAKTQCWVHFQPLAYGRAN